MVNPANIFLSMCFLMFSACSGNDLQVEKEEKVTSTETIVAGSKSDSSDSDTVVNDDKTFPVDSLLHTKILPTGTFHEDEVWPEASKQSWFGLFKDGKGYYLEQTAIVTSRVHDLVLDEDENTKTAWEVSTTKNDSNIILIHALPSLQNRKVEAATLSKNIIYPGDTVAFTFLGTDHKLFATGKKKKFQDDPEAYDVWDYKLYLSSSKEGKELIQLLVAQPEFNDAMIHLMFAGDIDGDGKLDLVIDTSNHYNVFSPTLYLSRPAEKTQIVTPVGIHVSVGC